MLSFPLTTLLFQPFRLTVKIEHGSEARPDISAGAAWERVRQGRDGPPAIGVNSKRP